MISNFLKNTRTKWKYNSLQQILANYVRNKRGSGLKYIFMVCHKIYKNGTEVYVTLEKFQL